MSNEQNTPDRTHVTVVLDRSGSMAAIAPQVVTGFNGFVADQAATPGLCRLTLVQFDSQAPFDVVTDAMPIAEMTPLGANTYRPRGGTPLYDALGNALTKADARVATLAENGLPEEDQLVVVITDGLENSSTDWTRDQVFDSIEARKADGWTFVFLGANQDAFAAGGQIGVARGNSRAWQADSVGTAQMMADVSASTTAWRTKSRSRKHQDRDLFFEDDTSGE